MNIGDFDPDTREICETLRQYLNERLYVRLAPHGSNRLSEVRATADGNAAFVLGWDGAEFAIEVRRSGSPPSTATTRTTGKSGNREAEL